MAQYLKKLIKKNTYNAYHKFSLIILNMDLEIHAKYDFQNLLKLQQDIGMDENNSFNIIPL